MLRYYKGTEDYEFVIEPASTNYQFTELEAHVDSEGMGALQTETVRQEGLSISSEVTYDTTAEHKPL